MGASTSLRWARCMGLALLASTLAACDGDDPSDEDDALRDARAVTHGVGSFDGAPRLAYFGDLFALPPDLVDGPVPESLLADAVVATHARLTVTFAAIGCDATVDSDGVRRVTLSLVGCRLLAWSIDAELEAEVRADLEPCGAEVLCATGIVWDLDITELSMRLLGLPPTRFSGPAELHAPIDADERMHWQTLPGFVIETPLGRRYETLSTASWRIDADKCIEVDIGARLSLEEREDDIDEQVGDVVVSARGLRRCPGQCPASGRVQLSFGAGQVLAWEHDGSGTIRVLGPRGRELEARLPCAQEASAGTGG